ncbi:ribose ABC transporter permease [Entomospira culicis]|uniref:Ribose ABC transporter permease n=2 Tax=Entomospira culicis TaxID=2719989 RepID=A0A968KX14_9SPIO|nr:ribose ABC transporter permease [Entomospira culicis]NIZ19648.1 ribose ABC transporter permease [Entomospira culicis]NIZ69862.1 ribose ABC transporter permease [Entomospira culicis]WDI37975.1 ribose ABC transporter permease [Entomospira culicis]WDI39598.1 ribose ABC transporter permease [Entomospira culicis]
MDVKGWTKRYQTVFALVLLVMVASLLSDNFLTINNMMNMLRQSSINAIIAFGMTLVILSGGIDLSVGSILAISSALAMSSLVAGQGGGVAMFIALVAGTLMGMSTGLLIAKAKLQPFIVTLIMMNLLRGATLVFTDGKPITLDFTRVDAFYNFIGNGKLGIIPMPVVVMLLVFGLTYYLLYHTKLGRYIYAVGGNEQVAHLSGINVVRVKVIIYGYMGFLAALAGVILSSRLLSAQPTAGANYELDAIASVVVGGTSLAGGVGGIGSTLMGALLIGVLNNALNLLQVSSYYQMIVKALVILVAVLLNRNIKK